MYANYLQKFLLFFLLDIHLEDPYRWTFSSIKNTSDHNNRELSLKFKRNFNSKESVDSYLFGLTSLNIFNPIFSDKEYSEYSPIINEIKNSSEFIGCRFNIQYQFPHDLENPYINYKFMKTSRSPAETLLFNPLKGNLVGNPQKLFNNSFKLIKGRFILSYLQFPIKQI